MGQSRELARKGFVDCGHATTSCRYTPNSLSQKPATALPFTIEIEGFANCRSFISHDVGMLRANIIFYSDKLYGGSVTGATTVVCVPSPVLGQQQIDQLILAPELRHLAHVSDTDLIRNLGFVPRMEADLLTGDLAFDLPIYFAADEKSRLIGGARFDYLTDGGELNFGIFVGQ